MLKINNFSKTYSNGHVAIANLNLTVEAGDIYAFIGSNGSGKTSTIKAIVGIHDFDGEIIVNGKKVSRKNETYKRKEMGNSVFTFCHATLGFCYTLNKDNLHPR